MSAVTSESTERQRMSRLLIVEDDEPLLRILTAIMQDEGYEVVGCTTANDALERVRAEDFAVAVVDLHLPDRSGTQLLEELRALSGRLHAIIYTGYGSFDSAKEALNIGAFAYVEKGGDPRELVGHVGRAFRAHLDRYTEDLEATVAERTSALQAANEALRESEERYRTLAESAQDLIYVIDADMRVEYVNTCAAAFLRGKPKEIAGKPLKELFPPAHFEHMEPVLRSVFETGEPSSTERKFTVKGRDLWLSAKLVPLPDSKGQVQSVLGISRDVTEAKQAEEALRQSELELSVIYDNAPIVMLLVDSERRVRRMNAPAVAMARRPEKEAIGLRGGEALRCIHARDDPKGCGFGPACEACGVRNSVLEGIHP